MIINFQTYQNQEAYQTGLWDNTWSRCKNQCSQKIQEKIFFFFLILIFNLEEELQKEVHDRTCNGGGMVEHLHQIQL